MPELPDVEVFRRYFAATALGRPVVKVEVPSPEVLQSLSPEALVTRATGRRFTATARHGKYLWAKMNGGGGPVFHFGMTGYLEYLDGKGPPPPDTRVRFIFEGGASLAFALRRKLGRLFWAEDLSRFVRQHGLGPDALDKGLSPAAFRQALDGTRMAVKTALMSQERIAGIGNVYSDEILFQAGIHPLTPASELSDAEIERLFGVVREVLKTAVARRADPSRMPGGFLLPHRKEGDTCPGGGGTVARIKVSGRSAYYCPERQPAGRES